MLPNGRGTLAQFVLALEWAAQRPEVQIVNISAGIFGYDAGLKDTVADLMASGLLPVVAVGNEGPDTNRTPGNYPTVVSVGAADRDGRVAGFSGGGRMIVDNQAYTLPSLVAPGAGVYSCVRGGGYEDWDGTSMATPVVTGVAALVLERYPGITVASLRGELYSMVRDLKLPPERQGRGLIQVTGVLDDEAETTSSVKGRPKPGRSPRKGRRG